MDEKFQAGISAKDCMQCTGLGPTEERRLDEKPQKVPPEKSEPTLAGERKTPSVPKRLSLKAFAKKSSNHFEEILKIYSLFH